ncbi:ASKHA domain-containing protein [Desulfovibrio sp. TomC]|uniref:ASKHA domain-containing protein n=1 Tax=Desulfovibrio sp. TomC TaxID=1562888 RepID=UPI000574C5D3|nr:ASKHA domain-containing protein [Desulfovibrio sp. TomC]KHK03954.1 putative electron transfer protein [Desulfovibrio sp. TomC]
MPAIRILKRSRVLDNRPGRSLLETLAAAGLMLPSPCGAAGLCGKCAVAVAGTNVPPPTEQECALFTEEELALGRRLACTLFPEADLDVTLPQAATESAILSDGYLPPFRLEPALVKKAVRLEPQPAASHAVRLAAALGEKRIPARLLRGLDWDDDSLTATFDDGRLVAVQAGDRAGRRCGLAVDIGTTTVVAALLDLDTGRELAARSAINPQTSQGFDVLSRLGFVMEQPEERVCTLQQAVVACVNTLAGELAAEAGLPPGAIDTLAVAANTTMLHLLLGIDPSSLGRAPFTPVFTDAISLPAAEIGLTAAPGARLYCLPSVSAYISADIVAGMQAAGLAQAPGATLFIDIGTNGEMVLANGGRLLACSCAAGPALEGMNISCGMRASLGAIEDVAVTQAGLVLTTIGNAPPTGLCGSGILAAIRTFLEIGLILPRGNLVKEQTLAADDPRRAHLCTWDGKPALRLVAGDSPVVVTQKDIRQVQLAKGALLSGLYALLEQAGLTLDAIDRVLIAGQFGAHLPVASLTGCGIIPRTLGEKVAYLGNTSKSGACLALLSQAARGDMEALAQNVRFLELSTLEGFDRLFVTCLDFPRRAG